MNTSILDGTTLRSETFYEHLDDAGYDCFLFNLPFSCPARIKGDIVPSWLDSDDQPPTPRNLYNQYEIESPWYPTFGGGVKENVEKMHSSVEHNCEQFLSVLKAEDHDFLFQLISETDWLQHDAYFDLFEQPDSDIGRVASEVLAEVDKHVERVSKSLNEDDRLLLISDHGFRAFDKQLYINDWLMEEGYLKSGNTKIGTKSDGGNSINLGILGQILFRQEWLHPILKKSKYVVERISGIKVSSEKGISMSKSDAFCLSKDEHAIRLSDDLSDGEEERITEEIINKLNSEEGIDAFSREEVYEGPFVDEAGEIIYTSTDSQVWRGPSGLVWRNSRKAHHSLYGIVTAIGFENDEGVSDLDASLLDISPTILGIAGCAIPTDIDGEPISDLLSEEPEYTAPTEYNIEPSERTTQQNPDAEERLRDLGYL